MGHKVVVEVQVQVLELLQLPDLHCRVALVDKVPVPSPTGLVVAAVEEDTMAAEAAVVVMTLDLEPVPLLEVVEDLDL